MKLDSYRDPLLAAFLAVFPGSGHVYVGRSERGLAWLAGTVAGLFLFIVPGLVIWAASMADAALCAHARNAAAPPLPLGVCDPFSMPAIRDDFDPQPFAADAPGADPHPLGDWSPAPRGTALPPH